MRIDAHQHFWNYDPNRDAWINDSMDNIKHDFLPLDLEPNLKENGYDGSVAIQANQSEEETSFLLKLAEEYDFIKGVVGWVDLKNGHISERLAYFSQFQKLVGFRHIVQDEDDDFMIDKDFRNGIKALSENGYTYDILIYPRQLKAAINLVEEFPEQPFVLDHIAKPDIKNRKFSIWNSLIFELAKFENVYCKVSGMVTEASWQDWKIEDFTPYLDRVFEVFGADRLMIGSDWPVCLLAGTYSNVIGIVDDYLARNLPSQKSKVLGDNAMNFYHLGAN